MHATSELGIHELDRRNNDGIDVTLLWNSQTNGVFVTVEDARRGASFSVDVSAHEALDAFHHPYAYADRAYGDFVRAA